MKIQQSEPESYDNLLKEAKLLAKRNWKLICDMQEVPKEYKWIRFGVWEFDEKHLCYKNILWSAMNITEEDLEKIKKEN